MTTKKRAARKVKNRGQKIEPSKKALRSASKAPTKSKDSPAKSRGALPNLSEVLEQSARHIEIQWRDSLSNVSQKHAEKLRRLFEKSQRGLALADDFARAHTATSDAVLKARDFVIPHFEIPAFPKLAPPELDKIDFELSTIKTRAGAIRMADAGWTVAEWMAPGYIASFDRTPFKSIDDFFVQRYLGLGSFKGRLRFTADELLASPHLKPWKPLLRQTFECLQQEKYIVCVPALIIVIEEFVSESVINNLNQPQARVRPHQKRENAKHGPKVTMDGLIWSSSVVFLHRLFSNPYFGGPAPPPKNRHGQFHTRTETRWNRAHALKLVHALAALHWLLKPES